MKLNPWYRSLLVLPLSVCWCSLALAQQQGSAQPRRGETPEQAVRRAMEDSWPDRPEWVDELADILQDTGLGPNDGWHRRSQGQSRFDWKRASKKLDKNGDGQISRAEFSGTDTDFNRLDRDHDRSLTAVDFDFSPSALVQSPGSLLLYVMDDDGNGKVTREEFEAFFRKADSGNLGFLSLNDMQNNFRAGTRAPVNPNLPGPTRDSLVRALFRQELGSLEPGPSLGDKFKDFTLKTVDGKDEVTLSKKIGTKPVVLVFGNFTCGPFRSQAGNVEKLYQLYKDRAEFVMIYIREAHPTDGWRMDANDQVGIAASQPRTYEERVAIAKKCAYRLSLGFPMLVDTIDDSVGVFYSGMPSRLYLFDRDGKVAYKSGRGPYGFKPAELEHSLLMLLESEQASRKAEDLKIGAAPNGDRVEGAAEAGSSGSK